MRIGGAALVPNAEGPAPNRWLIAVACVTVQTGLGTVYSWSVYRRPLSEAFGWSITEVTMTFSVLILTAGFAAFLGGVWMRRSGPRRVAVCAGVLYGAGLGLASLSADRLPLLYLTYGLIGGAGVGLGYIVPIATLIKWFPDRTGFITGVAVSGVAAGSLVASPIAARLIESIGVLDTFAVLGAVYLILVVGAALALRDPPAGYRPAGWTPPGEGGDSERRTFDLRGALRTWQWYLLWAIFFLNVTAGVGFISEGAPMARDVVGIGAIAAAGLVGTAFIGDAVGRLAWPWLSDAVGRRTVLVAIFLIQAGLFVSLSLTSSPAAFAVLGALILFCYGGSSGTMAAATSDLFGSRNVGPIYGLMLTAWGFGGVLGPLIIAILRESTGSYTSALQVIAAIMLASVALPLAIRPPQAGLARARNAPSSRVASDGERERRRPSG
ncbi:MAG TPA: OFA family MFS transporter [Thermoleophilaceae bacterium]|nr:OFA family MFS transporter [Thermoleophilaceae bacterium]